jgi:hypothetical protein
MMRRVLHLRRPLRIVASGALERHEQFVGTQRAEQVRTADRKGCELGYPVEVRCIDARRASPERHVCVEAEHVDKPLDLARVTIEVDRVSLD